MANVLNVARREFTVRVRTRSFQVGTAILVVGVLAFAFLPVIGRLIDSGETKPIALYVNAADLPADPAHTLGTMLNASAQGTPGGPADYEIETVTDLAAARAGVGKGDYLGALAIVRSATGDLTYEYFLQDATSVRSSLTAALVQQAAQSLAVADRLERLGIDPGEQAALFDPVAFAVHVADPASAGVGGENYLIGFGLSVLIFTMIVLYGSWIAMSVVEEKSSRVAEVVLNAATPFQLLAGKVIGVGALAFLHYLAILLAGGAALLLQGVIATTLLGDAGSSVGVPAGLNLGTLVLLPIYGILGFFLYAVLFAAAASLVSRQEEVNQAIMPVMLVAIAGYMVSVYASTGLLDARAGWLAAMAQIPFFSPFMMLSRVAGGAAGPAEVVLSIALLVVAIVGALWVAARIYGAGVLLYGQRPSLRRVWRLVRSGG